MKKIISFIVLILIGILIFCYGCKPSAEDLFYSQLQKDLSGEGRFTFEGPDGKRYRYWTVSDILLIQKNRDKIFDSQIETMKKYQFDNIQISDSIDSAQLQVRIQDYHNMPNFANALRNCKCNEGRIFCNNNGNNVSGDDNGEAVCRGTSGGNSRCEIIAFWEGKSRCFIVNDLFNMSISKFNASLINPIGLDAPRNLSTSIRDFDPNNIQIADFGVCSNNLDIGGQYAVDIELINIDGSEPIYAASLPMLIGNP